MLDDIIQQSNVNNTDAVDLNFETVDPAMVMEPPAADGSNDIQQHVHLLKPSDNIDECSLDTNTKFNVDGKTCLWLGRKEIRFFTL